MQQKSEEDAEESNINYSHRLDQLYT